MSVLSDIAQGVTGQGIRAEIIVKLAREDYLYMGTTILAALLVALVLETAVKMLARAV